MAFSRSFLASVAFGLLLPHAAGLATLSPAILSASGDAGAPLFDTEHSLNHFIVVPEHKLLFCYIEKVGCTSFNNVFRFLRERYDKSQATGSVWLRNTPQDHNISTNMLRGILKDKAWHKAVFYREPMERFISAYKSKCEGADWRYGRSHCRKMFGNESVAFVDAVGWIREFDRHHANDDDAENDLDEHFRRQTDFCGGLDKTLQYYDTVEELDRSTAHAKVSKLLHTVGVKADTVPHFNEFFPPPGDDSWEEKRHNTNSGDQLDEYVPQDQPSLARALINHYRRDYEAFDIDAPGWAAKETNSHGDSFYSTRGGPFLGGTSASPRAAAGPPPTSHWLTKWPLVGATQVGEGLESV